MNVVTWFTRHIPDHLIRAQPRSPVWPVRAPRQELQHARLFPHFSSNCRLWFQQRLTWRYPDLHWMMTHTRDTKGDIKRFSIRGCPSPGSTSPTRHHPLASHHSGPSHHQDSESSQPIHNVHYARIAQVYRSSLPR